MGQLEDMNAFVRIVESGGIGRAAHQLGIAKSAVSRRLNELEIQLGVKLLNRTTRALTLTDAGRLYYERAVKVIEDVAELNAFTANTEAQLRGSIRVSLPVTFGNAHMGPAINDFLRRHPELEFTIDFSDRQVDLIQEGIDLAIRIDNLSDSSLIARKITPISTTLCASPNYLEEFGMPHTPEDLKNHKVMRYIGTSSGSWRLIDNNGDVTTMKPKAKLSANNGDFLCYLACEGHGIIISPTFICWQELAQGRLVELMPDYRVEGLNAFAVYPKTRYLSERARAFIDHLIDYFGDTPYWDNWKQNQD